ncbi:hypothetical protein ZTR_08665 [Talaromyces verruculosus]|nr:hypothetical protein ZTR_08665 [Talaromyces verruculosus]
MDVSYGSRLKNTARSSHGCWTCRIRRKKCDEIQPVCDACSALHITCYFGPEKPDWMDGDVKQEQMAERLKREVKERRRGERAAASQRVSHTKPSTGETRKPRKDVTPVYNVFPGDQDIQTSAITVGPGASSIILSSKTDCATEDNNNPESKQPDIVLLTFYLEQLLPFLFPFYQPSPLEGGRAWILEMTKSRIIRQAILCQSSYFFSLMRGATNGHIEWDTVLSQTKDAFEMLRQSLEYINGPGTTEQHGINCTIKILVSIIHIQHFEITVLNFNNCYAHLNAALALFRQLLDDPTTIGIAAPNSSFDDIMRRLNPGSASWPAHLQYVSIPSSEQAAFRFSSTLLILDDIIASMVLQEPPQLYKYHRSLLGTIDGVENEPSIDFEDAIACQNWVILQIGEIAVLDAWKHERKRAGNLDVIELVHRATAIRDTLETRLAQLETNPFTDSTSNLDSFIAYYTQQSKMPASKCVSVSRVWAHAALIYLFVVVSGWQPASVNVRYHRGQILELLSQVSPPALLRTMVWPFCVAGCLAEPAQESHLRAMVEALQPPSIFGTVHKALEIMEYAWHNHDLEDLAMCFKSQGDLVLLV